MTKNPKITYRKPEKVRKNLLTLAYTAFSASRFASASRSRSDLSGCSGVPVAVENCASSNKIQILAPKFKFESYRTSQRCLRLARFSARASTLVPSAGSAPATTGVWAEPRHCVRTARE